MQMVLSNFTASISELKKSPTALLKSAGDEPIAILNHNVPSAYLVSSKTFEKMVEIVDDYLLSQNVKERLEDRDIVEVTLDEL